MKDKKHILLVEDSDRDTELIIMQLRSCGDDLMIDRAADGVEAMAYLRREGAFADRYPGDPAVVLLDIKLPRMSGLEVLDRMKSDPRLRRIPVVMLTSSREKSDLLRSYDSGVNAYVVKPVEFKDLGEVLRHTGYFWCAVNETSPASDRGPQ